MGGETMHARRVRLSSSLGRSLVVVPLPLIVPVVPVKQYRGNRTHHGHHKYIVGFDADTTGTYVPGSAMGVRFSPVVLVVAVLT